MLQGLPLIEWLVKTAITDESVSTDYIINLMKKNNITSMHLINYVNEDSFWTSHKSDTVIPPKDEKYILNLKNPNDKLAKKNKEKKLWKLSKIASIQVISLMSGKRLDFNKEIFIKSIVRLINISMRITENPCNANVILCRYVNVPMNPVLRLIFQNHRLQIRRVG
jgi:hypothetical protein